MYKRAVPGTFFEMLRSFVALAETLNVSKATERLDSTRQTIKRHVADLQAIKGQSFFDNSTRRYQLTPEGHEALIEARSILVQTNRWITKSPSALEEFSRETFQGEDQYLFVQEHPIIDVWHIAPNLLRSGLKAWVDAGGMLEHEAMADLRPYLLLFRDTPEGWLCIDVGDKSSIAGWLGWAWAKSSIGTYLDTSRIESKTGREMTDGYAFAATSGGICYEHVSARMPHGESGKLEFVNYQRLVFSCLLPNKEKILASLVFRTNDISISGIENLEIPKMKSKYQMEDIDL